MNEVTRRITEEILGRADEAIGRGEAERSEARSVLEKA